MGNRCHQSAFDGVSSASCRLTPGAVLPLTSMPESTSEPLTSSGFAFGWCSSNTAAAPETSAVDIEVPLPLKYTSPMRACGLAASIVEPAARSDTTETPGATRSGFE
jgi:hypothetical protein